MGGESEFNGRIAHGMLLLSYCVGLVPLDPDHVLALRGFERVAFKRPVGSATRSTSRAS